MPSSPENPCRKKSPPKPVKNHRKGGNPIPLEARSRGGKRGGAKSTRLGVPDGCRREEITALRAKAETEAKAIVGKMIEQGIIDDDVIANEALTFAIGIVRTDRENAQTRLQAARMVLDFCKKKPAEKKEVVLSQAEQFLNAILEDDGAA